MLFSKPQSVLGIDLGAGGIKLVELKKEKNRPVLFTYGITSMRQDVHHLVKNDKTAEDLVKKDSAQIKKEISTAETLQESQVNKYAETLKMVCQKSRTVAKQAIVSLPVSAVFHALVTLPIVKKEEFPGILKAEVKKLLPRPLDEMALDYQVLPTNPDKKNQQVVLINAVPKNLVALYTQIFRQAGLVLEALEPESTALERSLIGRDTAVSMIIDLGAERTNFFIMDQAVPITHHSIEAGGHRVGEILSRSLDLPETMVDRLKIDLCHPESQKLVRDHLNRERFVTLFNGLIDPILKEIEYSFELYLRQSGNENKRPEKVILTGGIAVLPYLSEIIAEKFKLKCYVGDPWARVVYQDSLKPLLSQLGPRMSVAIGLALRNMV